MADALRVSELRFTEASEADARTGVIGWVRFIVNEALALDGVVLRRTVDGRATLSFPARRDGRGVQRFFVRPISDEARCNLERQIFERLHLERDATS